MLQMPQVTELARSIKRSAFRLETLSEYKAKGEVEELRAFREGRPRPPRNPDTNAWLRNVADKTAIGCTWQRVHLVDRPLSEYLRFEFIGYEENIAAGEDVRIADRATVPAELAALTKDFWLYDEEIVVVMNYDDDFRFVGGDVDENVAPYLEIRDLALAHSVPLHDYLPLVEHELHRG